MSAIVTIQHRETGEKRSGNWASLRKSFGYANGFKLEKLRSLFDEKGWDVVSGDIQKSATPKIGIANLDNEIDSLAESPLSTPAQPKKAEAANAPIAETETEAEIEDVLTIPFLKADYITREVDEVVAALLDAKQAEDEHETLFLYGGAGAGKTEAIKHYCAVRQLPYTRISLDETMTIQYIIGRLWFSDGQVTFKEGILVKALQRPGVIFLDEANAMLPSKGFILHQMLDSGEIYIPEADKFYRKHPACKIVLAGNYQSGSYTGVQKMNAALQNRLCPYEVPSLDLESFKFKHINASESALFVKFYKEVETVIEVEKSKAIISLRNAIRYDRLRGYGLEPRQAIALSVIDSIKYADPRIADQLIVNAKGHFGF